LRLLVQRAFDGRSMHALRTAVVKGSYPPIPAHYSKPMHLLVMLMLKVGD
jgi:hypothetical protein